MSLGKWSIFIFCVCATQAAPITATAQSANPSAGFPPFSGVVIAPPKPPQSPGSDLFKTMDAQLAANDMKGLATNFMKAPLIERMKWTLDRVSSGTTTMLAIAYINDLWGAGLAASQPDPQKDTRVTAGAIWLYVYQVMIIDAPRCEDPTAPNARRQSFLSSFRPIFDFIKAQPEAVRVLMLDTAVKLERSSASRRPNDHFLCSGGMAEITAATQQPGVAGKTVAELQNAPSVPANPGKAVVLPPAKGYFPKFIAESSYLPKQAEIRRALPKQLVELLK